MKAGSLLGGCLFYGILGFFAIVIAIMFVSAVIGIVTGDLWLMPMRGIPAQTHHGVEARIESGIILSIFAAILVSILRQRRKERALKSENNKGKNSGTA